MTANPSTTTRTAPTASRTPSEVFEHGLELLLAKDIERWVGLCADDVIFEFPFAPPGYPARLDGKESVSAYMADYPDHIDLQRVPEVEIIRTIDPAVIVVEMRAEGRVVATGGPFEMRYVCVVTVRDGRITRYRDYWNPTGVAEGFIETKTAQASTARVGTARGETSHG